MKYRKLGKTTIDVGIVGLGAEHLEHAPLSTVASVVHEAIDSGVNYIDLFLASPGVRDNIGISLKNKRHTVMVAGHLGAAFGNGQYYRTRDMGTCKQFFNDYLIRLRTDYIDALMLHWVDEPDDYEKVFGAEGLLDLAIRLKKEGKARFIGMSSHNVNVALKAVHSGHIDVLMFPINPAFDTLPGDIEVFTLLQYSSYNQASLLENSAIQERKELYHTCANEGVGIMAMKPYAAGRLLTKGNPSSIVLTPVQCVNYALSQPGVCTVVPGCKNAKEVKDALAFLDATDEEKDYSAINKNPVWSLRETCMYCNHCLPCPVGIDIGRTMRIIDIAEYEITANVVLEYEALSPKASDCIECGVCMENCPFGVNVIASMSRAVGIFGK